MPLLAISKQDVQRLLPMKELIDNLKEAYIGYSRNKSILMQRAVALIDNSSIVVNFPGCIADDEYYTVKVNVKNADNTEKGLPFLQGTILLIDRSTGEAVALFESGLITAMRTGAAGAIGVEALASLNANKIALIGAGVQGEWQLRALQAIGRLHHVNIYDINDKTAVKLADDLSGEFGIVVNVCDSIENALTSSDIIITTTPVSEPILFRSMLATGVHINAFGADQPGKTELSADLINSSLLIVDDRELALSHGALNVPYQNNALSSNSFPEIGDVLAGKAVARSSSDQVTVFGNVGLAFQDAIACKIIYKKAIEKGIGQSVELG